MVVATGAKDSFGVVLTFATWRFPRTNSAFCAELLTIRVRTKLAVFRHPQDIVIESDFSKPVHWTRQPKHPIQTNPSQP